MGAGSNAGPLLRSGASRSRRHARTDAGETHGPLVRTLCAIGGGRAGRPPAFVLVDRRDRLGITGPLFGFSDIWQLVINTGTATVTFLMAFLIQNAQNRDAAAIQCKLDEMIRAMAATNSSASNI